MSKVVFSGLLNPVSRPPTPMTYDFMCFQSLGDGRLKKSEGPRVASFLKLCLCGDRFIAIVKIGNQRHLTCHLMMLQQFLACEFKPRKRAEHCFESSVSEAKITEFCGNLGEFCEKLGEFALVHKYQAERNSLSSFPGSRWGPKGLPPNRQKISPANYPFEFLKFGVAMSIGMYCLTYSAAENARLLSKQIVCLKIPSNTHTHEDFLNPNRQRPAHALVLPPRTSSLGPLLTPHQRNRQDPLASFCEDGEHRVWKAPRSVPLSVPLNAPLSAPRSVPLSVLTAEISQFSSWARFALWGTLRGTLRGTLLVHANGHLLERWHHSPHCYKVECNTQWLNQVGCAFATEPVKLLKRQAMRACLPWKQWSCGSTSNTNKTCALTCRTALTTQVRPNSEKKLH